MSSITPRKGKGGVTYEARWLDGAGKECSKRFKLRKEAASFLASVGNRKYTSDRASMSVGQMIDQWLAACAIGRDGRPPVEINNTLADYTLLGGYLKARFADDLVSKLDRARAGAMRDRLVLDFPRPTAKRCLGRLKSAIRVAMTQGQIESDPFEGVTITISSRDKTEVAIPEQDEVIALLRQAHDWSLSDSLRLRETWRTYHLVVKVLMMTGMRPSELRGLPRKAIGVKEPTITISQRADKKGVIGAPKTAAGNRKIYIPDDLWDELRDYLVFVPGRPDALVFGNSTGNPVSTSNLHNYCWRPLLLACGLADTRDGRRDKTRYTLYALRHFFASAEIDAGADPKALQVEMGHENIEMTLNIYGHLFKASAGKQADRARQRGQLLSGAATPVNVVPFQRTGTE